MLAQEKYIPLVDGPLQKKRGVMTEKQNRLESNDIRKPRVSPPRRVLMVAYYFPPLGGVGVQRTLKFVKYLPSQGWQPVVLTVKKQNLRLIDHSLLDEIPPEAQVCRSRAILLPEGLPWRLKRLITRWLLLVDEQIGWFPFAINCAKTAVQQQSIDLIYSTSPPHTNHLVGYHLKLKMGLPWVADFRDPWLENVMTPQCNSLQKRVAQRLERKICLTADQIVVASEPMRQGLLRHYIHLSPNRVLTIPNGYDPDDFDIGMYPRLRPEQMTIVYTGSFYGTRTSSHFLRALKAAISDGRIPEKDLKVYLVGNVGKRTQIDIKKLGLDGTVFSTGYLPHRQAISHLLAGDLLLTVVGSGPGHENAIPAKIFEYLAAKKPILTLAKQGAAADLVSEARAGVVVDPEGVEMISNQIAAFYRQWKAGTLKIENSPHILALYDRRRLTGVLAQLFDELTEEGKKTP